MKVFGIDVVIDPNLGPDEFRFVPPTPILRAAAAIGATPSDIPGLWNAPGYPELTTGQLLAIAGR